MNYEESKKMDEIPVRQKTLIQLERCLERDLSGMEFAEKMVNYWKSKVVESRNEIARRKAPVVGEGRRTTRKGMLQIVSQ